MNCETQRWKLEKYGRYLGSVARDKAFPAKTKSKESNKWKIYDCSEGNLLLTVTDSHHLLVTLGNQIQENHSLWNAGMWMKGVTKDDSLLIIYKLQDEARQFRVKFLPVDNKTGREQCLTCSSRLSRYLAIKHLDLGQVSREDNQSEVQLTSGEVTLGKLAEIVTGQLSAQLPKAYQTTRLPADPAVLQSLVQLCLSDTNFPAFVGAVEDVLRKTMSETDTALAERGHDQDVHGTK